MDYKFFLTPKAESQLTAIPEAFRERVVEGLRELCDSPVQLSRRAPSPPYPPGEQLYEFSTRDPIFGTLHHVAIFFRYGQDEETLIIYFISCHARFEDDPDLRDPLID